MQASGGGPTGHSGRPAGQSRKSSGQPGAQAIIALEWTRGAHAPWEAVGGLGGRGRDVDGTSCQAASSCSQTLRRRPLQPGLLGILAIGRVGTLGRFFKIHYTSLKTASRRIRKVGNEGRGQNKQETLNCPPKCPKSCPRGATHAQSVGAHSLRGAQHLSCWEGFLKSLPKASQRRPKQCGISWACHRQGAAGERQLAQRGRRPRGRSARQHSRAARRRVAAAGAAGPPSSTGPPDRGRCQHQPASPEQQRALPGLPRWSSRKLAGPMCLDSSTLGPPGTP